MAFLKNHNEETGDNAYVLEVDLEYPNELHELQNCYPLAFEITTKRG